MSQERLAEEWGSIREITVLTPDTFTRKMIPISTTWRFSDSVGQTAICQQIGLNYFDIDIRKCDWQILKSHTNLDEARKYHKELVESKHFVDCDIINLTDVTSGSVGEKK